jgi:hypothetical protein
LQARQERAERLRPEPEDGAERPSGDAPPGDQEDRQREQDDERSGGGGQ